MISGGVEFRSSGLQRSELWRFAAWDEGTVALDMQGLVSEMQSSCPRCMAQGSLHLGNLPAPVHPVRFATICYETILPRPEPFASRKPTCAGSPRTLLFYYFTISLLFYYVLFTLLFAIILFYHDHSRLHLGNRPAPVHPGLYYFTILLFYYFTISILLFYYVLFTVDYSTICYYTILPRPEPFASRKPTYAGSPRTLLFYYFTILLFLYFYTTLLLCPIYC